MDSPATPGGSSTLEEVVTEDRTVPADSSHPAPAETNSAQTESPAQTAASARAAPGRAGPTSAGPGIEACPPGDLDATGSVLPAPTEPAREVVPADGTGPGRGMAGRLRGWWAALPPAVQALTIYVISRCVDFVIIGRVARFQKPSLWNGPDPGYLGLVSLWDGDWYRRIAEFGYPAQLPLGAQGQVNQNEWAFLPLYPYTVRVVMWLTGGGWPIAASVVSLLCGAVTMVVLRSLVEPVAGRSLALWTVALLCAYPAAPVLQLAYAESLSLMLLVTLLLFLQRRWYLGAVPVLLLADVSRPISVPLAATVGVHLVMRWRRRRVEPLPGVAVAELLALVFTSGLGVVLWPAVAARTTGRLSAYLETEGAWRSGQVLAPVQAWWNTSRFVLGDWFGPVTLVLVGVALLIWITRPRAAVIAGDLRAWCLCYLGYLLVVFDLYTATVRILLPLFPLGTLLAAASPSRAYRRALVAAFVAAQVVWVAWLWRFSPPTDWPP